MKLAETSDKSLSNLAAWENMVLSLGTALSSVEVEQNAIYYLLQHED